MPCDAFLEVLLFLDEQVVRRFVEPGCGILDSSVDLVEVSEDAFVCLVDVYKEVAERLEGVVAEDVVEDLHLSFGGHVEEGGVLRLGEHAGRHERFGVPDVL